MKTINGLWVIFNYWRTAIAYLLINGSRFAEKARKDIEAYCQYEYDSTYRFHLFSKLLVEDKTLRNVLLNRLHRNPIRYMIFRLLFAPLESLYINMPSEAIGGGITFQHGFSTIVAAKSIGENCRINQQCTIGYMGSAAPTIDDNCRIYTGAIIIGDVHLHSGCIVGAGAVVINDISKNGVAVGVPARELGHG